ncbi:MAG: DUF5689 domain-containing protein [Chitinophagaceae bacterium]
MKPLNFLLIAALGLAFLNTGCLKKNSDNPPDKSGYDPGLTITNSLKELRLMNGRFDYKTGGAITTITGDIIVAGIITADDRSGNLYKAINVEDSTGGMQVMIDAYSLYNSYPVGRKIYIRCKGLTLGYNGGTPVLGMGVSEQNAINAIPGSEIANHLVKADIGHIVTPKPVTMAQLAQTKNYDTNLINRLVIITDAQFADTIAGITYTQPNGSTNRNLTDCSGKIIALRSSNYATFHAIPLPAGKGTITGLYSIYASAFSGAISPQLTMRDTSDVQMNEPRCGGNIEPTPTVMVTIDSLRKMYPGTGIYTIPSVKVTGVVISDLSKGNASTGNFILEDKSQKGIILYISGGSYNLGDSLVFDATGGKLQLYNGAMELTGMTTSKITKAGTGKKVVPIQKTLAELTANFKPYESVLVKVVNATINGGGIYSGNKTLSDGTGTFSLYTAPTAAFAGTNVPTTPKTFVGIGTLFTPNEIKLRDPSIDVY